jgi:branched-chain amino acid transport system ATP-binding protein
MPKSAAAGSPGTGPVAGRRADGAPELRDVLLAAEGLVKRFGGVTAVSSVSLSIHAEEIVGIMGPNGSGKTTLFNMLTGFLRPDNGRITWRGADISHEGPHTRARRGLVRTFQQSMVLPGLSVVENLQVAVTAAQLSERRPPQVAELMDYVGLNADRQRLAGDLSWGNSRLLGVGIALALRPDLLLVDEPFAGLSISDADRISSVVRQIRDDGHSLCIVDHKMMHLLPLCDRVLVLVNGTVLAEGRPAEVIGSPEVQSAYLGVL